MAIGDAELDAIEGSGVGGVESEVEGGRPSGEAAQGETLAEEAYGVRQQRALRETCLDKEDGFVDEAGGRVSTCGDSERALSYGLVDGGLIRGDDGLGGTGDVVDTKLLRDAGAEVSLTGGVNGVEAKVEDDLGGAVEEIEQGTVEGVEGARGSAQCDVAGGVLHAELLDVEDLADHIGDFAHLLRSKARGVEGFLVEVLEASSIGNAVRGNQDARAIERNGKEAAHAQDERNGLGGSSVIKVEMDSLRCGGGGDGVVEGRAKTEAQEDLTDGCLQVAVKMEVLMRFVGSGDDGAGEVICTVCSRSEGGRVQLGLKGGWCRDWLLMLEHDVVVRVQSAGLSNQGTGLSDVAQQARLAGLLHQSRDAMLESEGGGDVIVGDRGVELLGTIEGGLGFRKVIVLEEFCPCDVGIAGGIRVAGAGPSRGWRRLCEIGREDRLRGRA